MASNNNNRLNLSEYEPALLSGAQIGEADVIQNYRAVTASTTLVANTIGNRNADSLLEVTANSLTVTLPTAVGAQGSDFNIKNSGSGTVTVAAAAGQTIDGQATQTLTQFQSLTVVSNGTNYIII